MTVPGAVELIRGLAPTLPDGFLLGAGTVIDAGNGTCGYRRRRAVRDRQPGVQARGDRRLSRSAVCAAAPGCFTPTEILDAHDAGADIVKVFPATALGPQYIKDVRAPLPQVKLMPTGGVTLDNAGDWIRAGAVAVGAGSALLDASAIESGRFDVLTANARRIVANVAAARA